MQYKTKPLHAKLVQKRKAVDVLYEKMNFYDNRALLLATDIVKFLKEGDKSRGDKLADMYKAMLRLDDVCIECAKVLAGYQSPKLQSVEVKKTVEHRFVLKAPSPVSNTTKWLSQVDQEAKLLPPPPTIKNEKEDIEEIDYEEQMYKEAL